MRSAVIAAANCFANASPFCRACTSVVLNSYTPRQSTFSPPIRRARRALAAPRPHGNCGSERRAHARLRLRIAAVIRAIGRRRVDRSVDAALNEFDGDVIDANGERVHGQRRNRFVARASSSGGHHVLQLRRRWPTESGNVQGVHRNAFRAAATVIRQGASPTRDCIRLVLRSLQEDNSSWS